MRIIRWWGLGVFAGLVLVLAGGWWLFADVWLERAVEGAGTRMVGAKVELRDADLGLFPIRVGLNGLQVTNPRRPMRNALAAERIAFNLDTRSLVFGRTRIEEVAVEGAALGTERTVSGALPRRQPRSQDGAFQGLASRLELPGLSLPDVGTVLAQGELQTLEEARALKSEAGAARGRLARRAEALPGEPQVKAYRRRLERLRGEARRTVGSMLEGGKEASDLKKEISADIQRIQDLKRDVSRTRKDLRQRQQRLQQMPDRDAARLARKYGPSGEGLGNVAEAFLGPRVAGWMRRGWYWYGVARPYLGSARDRLKDREGVTATKPLRNPGLTIHFPQGAAEPRTVIRKVIFSREGRPGSGLGLTGEVTDITAQPSLWPEPLVARLSDPGGRPGYTLEAVMDHRGPGPGSDRLDLDIAGASVAGWRLGEGTSLPLRVEEGTADVSVRAQMQGGEVDARVRATIQGAVLNLAAEGEGELARAVADSLAGVDAFTLQARIRGTPDDPRLELASSLERPLGEAVKRVAQNRAGALEKDLRKALAERLEAPMEQVAERLSGLASLEERIGERLTAFRELRGRI